MTANENANHPQAQEKRETKAQERPICPAAKAATEIARQVMRNNAHCKEFAYTLLVHAKEGPDVLWNTNSVQIMAAHCNRLSCNPCLLSRACMVFNHSAEVLDKYEVCGNAILLAV